MPEITSAGAIPSEGTPQQAAPAITLVSSTLSAGSIVFSHLAAPHTAWHQEITYNWSNRVTQIPVAGLGAITPAGVTGTGQRQPAKIVQLSAPSGSKIVSWTATRIGALPICPHPIPSDPYVTLHSASISLVAPALETNLQDHEFCIAGVYIYVMKVPVWVPTDLPTMGATGYDSTPASSNKVPPDIFVQGLF